MVSTACDMSEGAIKHTCNLVDHIIRQCGHTHMVKKLFDWLKLHSFNRREKISGEESITGILAYCINTWREWENNSKPLLRQHIQFCYELRIKCLMFYSLSRTKLSENHTLHSGTYPYELTYGINKAFLMIFFIAIFSTSHFFYLTYFHVRDFYPFLYKIADWQSKGSYS